MPRIRCTLILLLFFFNDTATTEIYTLSLHDALPISRKIVSVFARNSRPHELPLAFIPINIFGYSDVPIQIHNLDRKSTRLNSSHSQISYAVFCLKKKKSMKRKESLNAIHGKSSPFYL